MQEVMLHRQTVKLFNNRQQMKNNTKKETRQLVEGSKITSENSRQIVGYAAVFDTWSQDLGGFIEQIDKRAFDGVVEKSDVMAVLNHNIERGLLARSKNGEGSLNLEVDEIGLKYTFEAPKTAIGDEVLEGVKRGDITASSFVFTVESDEWDFTKSPAQRTIKKVNLLFDISPVYTPAYLDTTVAQRSIDTHKEETKINAQAAQSEYRNRWLQIQSNL